ncbi:hypothetical protein DPMN_117305 [Dreissena polymorpha]|uniref:Uncharacterized protein n=1 Tax=Dreissena polymorpha TaxID=45954 RepID=A0A9D4KQE1_DREPO|nr:hypothetical protein DPMN_117305 [Dreissena polymorpha]
MADCIESTYGHREEQVIIMDSEEYTDVSLHESATDNLAIHVKSKADGKLRIRCRKLKNPRRGKQFMQQKEEIKMMRSEETRLANLKLPGSTNDSGPGEYTAASPHCSPVSPLDERAVYERLSPLARWKLHSRVQDSFFVPISRNADNGNQLSGSKENSDSVSPNSSGSEYSSPSNEDTRYLNLIKIKQIQSAFTITEDKEIPGCALSLGHVYALKKRIIKREEEMSGGKSIGSDGSSDQSSNNSPQNVETDSTDSRTDTDCTSYKRKPLQTEPVDLSVKKSSPAHWYEDIHLSETENQSAANVRMGFRGLAFLKKKWRTSPQSL